MLEAYRKHVEERATQVERPELSQDRLFEPCGRLAPQFREPESVGLERIRDRGSARFQFGDPLLASRQLVELPPRRIAVLQDLVHGVAVATSQPTEILETALDGCEPTRVGLEIRAVAREADGGLLDLERGPLQALEQRPQIRQPRLRAGSCRRR